MTVFMKNLISTALVALFLVPALWAQSPNQTPTNGVQITGHINGLKDTTCVLAHYFGATQYIPKDTARLDGSGHFVFDRKTKLPEGLYIVVTPGKRYIELLMTDDQTFSFDTDTSNLVQQMKVTGSKENELFYTYQQQLSTFYDGAQALNRQKKTATDAAAVDKKLSDLQKQASDFRTKFLADNASTFTVKLLKASAEPEVPPAPKLASGRPDSAWVFNYFKQHFWDDFDFADERFVRTPFLQRKIDRYIKELTVQVPDSLIKEADFLVNKAIVGNNKEIKYYTIYYITGPYEKPTVMGTDGLFVHMFEKYYATGVMTFSDSSTLKSVAERVATMKPNLIGKSFVAPVTSDTLHHPIDFQKINADYTLVFFYLPSCGHCRESAPKIQKFADDYKGKGVAVVAIAIDQDEKEWKKFIQEFKLGNAINGMDLSGRTDFARQYDVWTTPTVYMLDKNKKIIARKLPIEQIEDFMLFYKKQHPTPPVTAAPKNAKASTKK